ncbi:hypothetical protein [Pseudomonas sp. CLCA07]
MSTIKMKNEHTGQFKEVPVGFSWTTFFFGFFPALLRGDWKNFMILFFLGPLTLGILNIVYWFKYNKIYTNDLVGQGFKAVMSEDEAAFMSAKIGIHLPIVASKTYTAI